MEWRCEDVVNVNNEANVSDMERIHESEDVVTWLSPSQKQVVSVRARILL
jgi:hypothetical protein